MKLTANLASNIESIYTTFRPSKTAHAYKKIWRKKATSHLCYTLPEIKLKTQSK